MEDLEMKDNNMRKISQIIDDEKENISSLKKELKELPAGRLIIRQQGNHFYFTEHTPKSEIGITKNHERVVTLARKAFLQSKIKNHSRNLSMLEEYYKALSNSQLTYTTNRLKKAGLDDAFLTKAQLWWRQHAQSCNPYMREHLKYKTSSGIVVRSKSERTIADRLEHYGITYRYEPCILAKNGHYEILSEAHESYPSYKGEKVFYPDFLILTGSEKIVVWEHMGLTDQEQYSFKAAQKKQLYNKLGFAQHTNLICTEERDIIDIETIDAIIQRFLY